jgi:hypothetical protein
MQRNTEAQDESNKCPFLFTKENIESWQNVAIGSLTVSIDKVEFSLISDFIAANYLKLKIPGLIKCTTKILSKIELVIKNIYHFYD